MKKMLSLLSAMVIVASSTSSLISCAERTIASLDDSGSDIKSASGDHSYHDITHWASDVITIDGYKSIFTNNMSNAFAEGTVLDYDHFVEYVNYKGDATDNSLVLAPFKLISDYQLGSNTGDASGELSKISTLEKYFKVTLYEKNDSAKEPGFIIANSKWDAQTSRASWVPPKNNPGHLKAELNTTSNVYVMDFFVSISPTADGIKAGYVGARTYVYLNDNSKHPNTNIGVFYSQNPEKQTTGSDNPLVIDTNDSKFSDGKQLNKNDKQWYMNKQFDYRYEVKFFFSVS